MHHFLRVDYQQLSTEERYTIAAMRGQRHSIPEIATALRRPPSTIRREIKRNCCVHDGCYRARFAVQKANGRRRRSRRNARYGPVDFVPIEALLRQSWSPEQIVGRFRREGLPVMSHETIYLHIWTDKEHGGSLWQHLRGACKQRRKRYGRKDSRGRLAGKRLITDRPSCVERRTRFGDWEADTVHGRGKPCVVTLVERKSGFLRVGPLLRPTVEQTNARIIELLRSEPHPLRTLTSDNGVEFHGYQQIEQALDLTFYFALPHHAWERGTSENTNGLLRQYLPKGSNLAHLTPRHCHNIAALLNHRPRRRLGFLTPHEFYYRSVLSTRR